MYLFFKKKTSQSLINIGTGKDKSITDYAKFIMKHLGVNFKIVYKKTKPNGTMRKVLDVSLAKSYGWKPKTSLKKGLWLRARFRQLRLPKRSRLSIF